MGNDLTSTCEPPKPCLREISIVAAGVLEYWIIDPLESTATFLVREGDAFVERMPRENVYHSQVFEGLELDTSWLWQRPLPPTMPIVRRLLGVD
jgi:Uma2 family endonuclease